MLGVPTPFANLNLRDDLPRYPPLDQLLRVTDTIITGPISFTSLVPSGPLVPQAQRLYIAATQQLRTDDLFPRDREPCLALDVNHLGLSAGYYLGRLAGSYNSLPVYEVIGPSASSISANYLRVTSLVANNITVFDWINIYNYIALLSQMVSITGNTLNLAGHSNVRVAPGPGSDTPITSFGRGSVDGQLVFVENTAEDNRLLIQHNRAAGIVCEDAENAVWPGPGIYYVKWSEADLAWYVSQWNRATGAVCKEGESKIYEPILVFRGAHVSVLDDRATKRTIVDLTGYDTGGGTVTIPNGAVQHGSLYTCTNTFADTNLTKTFTDAGTYLLTVTVATTIDGATVGTSIQIQLKNTTTGGVMMSSNSYQAGEVATTGRAYNFTTTLCTIENINAGDTIALQAKYLGAPNTATVGAPTRLTYTKLA